MTAPTYTLTETVPAVRVTNSGLVESDFALWGGVAEYAERFPTVIVTEEPAVTTYLATVLVNLDAPFRGGWEPGQRLATAAYLTVHGTTPEAALSQTWHVGNKVASDDDGNRYPAHFRSLSVGDVVLLGAPDVALAATIESVGFSYVDLGAVDRTIGRSGGLAEAIAAGAACEPFPEEG